jgi:hypothetical protein
MTVALSSVVGRRQGAEQSPGLPFDLAGGRRAVLGHPLRQAAARHVRHDQHDLVALVDHVEQPYDVGMMELAQYVGLSQQALPGAGDLAR